MTVLVTGGSGQVGMALRNVLPNALFPGRDELDLAWEPGRIEQVVVDLKPDIVINCAAYTQVDDAEKADQQALASQVNATAVMAVARACQRHVAWLIQLSTDYVLPDLSGDRDFVHDLCEQPEPLSVYARSKYLGEQGAGLCDSLVIRSNWIFGQGNNFVATMLRLGHDGIVPAVVCDQFGRPTYAPDLATAIGQLVKSRQGGHKFPSLMHLQNDGPVVSWYQFACETYRLAGLDTRPSRIATQAYAETRAAKGLLTAARPRNSVFDLGPAGGCGIQMPDWRDSLQRYLTATAPLS